MQRYNRGKNTHATVLHKRTCSEKNPTPAILEGYLNLHKIQTRKRRAQKTTTSYEQTNERRTFFVCLKSSLSQQPFRSAILPGHRAPLSTYTCGHNKNSFCFQISTTISVGLLQPLIFQSFLSTHLTHAAMETQVY
jgi:hypothetical protein